jgi:hypothetical protein
MAINPQLIHLREGQKIEYFLDGKNIATLTPEVFELMNSTIKSTVRWFQAFGEKGPIYVPITNVSDGAEYTIGEDYRHIHGVKSRKVKDNSIRFETDRGVLEIKYTGINLEALLKEAGSGKETSTAVYKKSDEAKYLFPLLGNK